jgi:hypothetical protein
MSGSFCQLTLTRRSPKAEGNNTAIRAVGEISQAATGDEATDITDDLAKEHTPWDIAYDALKEEEHDRIAAYEDRLSRVTTRGRLVAVAWRCRYNRKLGPGPSGMNGRAPEERRLGLK